MRNKYTYNLIFLQARGSIFSMNPSKRTIKIVGVKGEEME